MAHRLDSGSDASLRGGRSRRLDGDATVDGDGGELGSHVKGHSLFEASALCYGGVAGKSDSYEGT